eukprot:UN03509
MLKIENNECNLPLNADSYVPWLTYQWKYWLCFEIILIALAHPCLVALLTHAYGKSCASNGASCTKRVATHS